jgi:hypothetical protein
MLSPDILSNVLFIPLLQIIINLNIIKHLLLYYYYCHERGCSLVFLVVLCITWTHQVGNFKKRDGSRSYFFLFLNCF